MRNVINAFELYLLHSVRRATKELLHLPRTLNTAQLLEVQAVPGAAGRQAIVLALINPRYNMAHNKYRRQTTSQIKWPDSGADNVNISGAGYQDR